jgi:hypothetical protein
MRGRDVVLYFAWSRPAQVAAILTTIEDRFPAIFELRRRLEVLARQRIDRSAPPHPFTQAGRDPFDALFPSGAETFAGTLLVCDTTLFSSTVGGLDDLHSLWSNVVQRPRRA